MLALVRATAMLVLLGVGVCALAGWWAHDWGRRGDELEPSAHDAIVIFGTAVRADGTPGGLLRTRTAHAYELWRAGRASLIVCTGGVGRFSPSEARAAARLLIEWGVPERAILVEEASTNTRENALFAAQLLAPGASVIAVSEPFHLWRCARELRNAGLEPRISPSHIGWSQLPVSRRVFLLLREGAAVLRDLTRPL